MKSSKTLGFTWQDKEIYPIILENEQMQISLTNLGATLTSVFMPARDGSRSNVVLNNDRLEDYLEGEFNLGSTISRVAGRINQGKFTTANETFYLDKIDGNTDNHIHGGQEGLNKKVFEINDLKVQANQATVELYCQCLNMENGYPGNLDVLG